MAKRDRILERWNIEDRRGRRVSLAWWGGAWLVWLVLVLAVWYFAWPEQAMQLRNGLQQTQIVQENTVVDNSAFSGEDSYEIFVSKVVWSTNTLWTTELKKRGSVYQQPKLVLFRWATQSACGGAVSQVWPHYCPVDETIYIDETFFSELEQRYGAQWWDLAQAYVVAHEVWHHVQHQLWLTNQVQQWDNEASIELELQADCLAGVWIWVINEDWVLEENDLNEAIDAAEAVGDDSIQQKVQWSVNPETRTHGSSAQRKAALYKWYVQKNFEACSM